ncbi:hypothetical protein ACFL6R_05535 [Gemmatimonadota bacterium]
MNLPKIDSGCGFQERCLVHFMKRDKYRLLISVIGLLILPSALCSAQQSTGIQLYTGPLKIRSISGKITLQESGPPLFDIYYEYQNESSRVLRDTLYSSSGGVQFIQIGVRGTRVIAFTPDVVRTLDSHQGYVQTVDIDFSLRRKDSFFASPVTTVNIVFEMPPGVLAPIWTSLPLEPVRRRPIPNLPAQYRLKRDHFFLNEMRLIFSTGAVTLLIEKSITPNPIKRRGPAAITLSIRNIGSQNATDVILSDLIDYWSFRPRRGSEGIFHRPASASDRHMLWTNTVTVPAGGKISVNYRLRARHGQYHRIISPVQATLGGVIVGISNSIRFAGPPRRHR